MTLQFSSAKFALVKIVLTLLLEFLESQTVINGEAIQKVSESIVSLTETLNKLIDSNLASSSRMTAVSSISSDFLDEKLISDLVDIYFNTLHPSFPVLNPEWKQRIKAAQKNSREALLQYAIVCSTLKYLPPGRLTSAKRYEIYKQCKDEIILKSFEIKDIETLNALAVLAVDLIGYSNGPETWSILPLITSAVLHLGLHKEDELDLTNNITHTLANSELTSQDYLTSQSASILPKPQSWHEQEARRRLFWGIYVLDRYSAISTAFSFKIPTKEVDRYFPVSYPMWIAGTKPTVMCKALKKKPIENKADLLDEFGYLIDILQILSDIHEFLKTPVSVHSLKGVIDWQVKCRQLDMELENWFSSLPYEYRDISHHKTPTPMLLMLHATYQTSVIRLNSSAGYSQLQSEYFSVSLTAAKNCIKAGQVMSDIARVTLHMGLWKQLGPHFAWCIWVTARLLLVDCITLNKPLPEELDVLLAVLEAMGEFWPIASRYHTLLVMVCEEQLDLTNKKEKDMVDHHEEKGSKLPNNGEDRLTSSAIISDMNRNAYALDFILLKEKPGQHSMRNGNQKPSEPGIKPPDQTGGKTDDYYSGNGVNQGRNVDSNDVDIFEWFNWPKKLQLSPGNSGIQRTESTESFKQSLSSGGIGGLIERSIGKEDWLSPEAKKKHAEKTQF